MLQHGVDLAQQDRPPERPAPPVGSAAERAEVLVQRGDGLLLHPVHAVLGTGPHPGHHGHALVDGRLDAHPGADQATTIEGLGDPTEAVVTRQELFEADAAGLARHIGNDEHPHRAGPEPVLTGRHATHPGHLGRGFAGQLLEVLDSHGTTPRPQHERAPELRVLQRFGITSANAAMPVLDPVDVRDRGREHGDRTLVDVADLTAADREPSQPQRRTLLRGVAVEPQRPVLEAQRGAEAQLPVDAVERVVPISGAALREVCDRGPGLPAVAFSHLEAGVVMTHDRRVLHCEALAGRAVRDTQHLLVEDPGMDRIGGTPNRMRTYF